MKDMRLGAMAAEFEVQLNDKERYGGFSFEERLGMLVDAEWNRRQRNKITRYTRNAHLAEPQAVIEKIEYYTDRKLNKEDMLRLSICKFIDDHHHLVLEGASGNGKTFIACALGNAGLQEAEDCTVHADA
jgi:DNA replication protein DnaC